MKIFPTKKKPEAAEEDDVGKHKKGRPVTDISQLDRMPKPEEEEEDEVKSEEEETDEGEEKNEEDGKGETDESDEDSGDEGESVEDTAKKLLAEAQGKKLPPKEKPKPKAVPPNPPPKQPELTPEQKARNMVLAQIALFPAPPMTDEAGVLALADGTVMVVDLDLNLRPMRLARYSVAAQKRIAGQFLVNLNKRENEEKE